MRSALYFVLSCIILLSAIDNTAYSQGIAVNSTGAVADTSAILDVSATNKGFLPPRMTAAQIAAINVPATGLVAYQTDGTTGLYINNGTPAAPSWSLVNSGTIIPFNSGANAISLSANFGGTSLNAVIFGFGGSTNISPFSPGTISATGNSGSFAIPRDGVITSLSGNFTLSASAPFTPTYVIVQVYTADPLSTTFSPVSDGLFISFGPVMATGTISANSLSDLSIPVAAGTKVLLACYLNGSVPGTTNITGYFSGGINFR